MGKSILLVGGGGHCKSVLDTVAALNQYEKIGIVDRKELTGQTVLNTLVVGSDDDLGDLYNQGFTEAFVTVGSVGSPKLRIKLFNLLKQIGFSLPNIIDHSASVSPFAHLEEGIFVGKRAVVNAAATIEKGVIINTASVVEHDCVIGAFAHLAPGSLLCGEVKIGENTHVGANSVIKQQVTVGKNTVIGMGSNVIKDIGDNVTAFGHPCKEVQR